MVTMPPARAAVAAVAEYRIAFWVSGPVARAGMGITAAAAAVPANCMTRGQTAATVDLAAVGVPVPAMAQSPRTAAATAESAVAAGRAMAEAAEATLAAGAIPAATPSRALAAAAGLWAE